MTPNVGNATQTFSLLPVPSLSASGKAVSRILAHAGDDQADAKHQSGDY